MPGREGFNLTHVDDGLFGATRTDAVVGPWSEILRWTAPDEMVAILPSGVSPMMKLYSAGTTDIDSRTLVQFAYKEPGKLAFTEIISVPYRAWANLTQAEQQSALNKANLTLSIKDGGIVLKENWQLGVLIKQPLGSTVMESWATLTTQASFINLPIQKETLV